MSPVSPIKPTAQPSLIERTRNLLTPLNLHFAGVGLLALLNLYLLIHMALTWQAARSQDATAIGQQSSQMHMAEHAAQPLRGLDSKLTQATGNADTFYDRRLPFADSQVIAELGALARKQSVKLTRVSLAYDPILAGAVGNLTEVRMDATLSGDYRPLMLFLNSLERDRLFFLISGITLTGQQSGTVNLRMKLNTYLRAPRASESTGKIVPVDSGNTAVGNAAVSNAAATVEVPR